jgi:hypothetical protein
VAAPRPYARKATISIATYVIQTKSLGRREVSHFNFRCKISLVNFDNTAKFFDIFNECSADFVAHFPRGTRTRSVTPIAMRA